MASHRQIVEKALGNKRDQFQKEHEEDLEDLDALQQDDLFKNDSQYQELLGGLQGPNKKKITKALEDIPKYKGKKVSRKQLELNQDAEESNHSEDDANESEKNSEDQEKEDLMISDSDLEESEEGEEDEQDKNMDEEEDLAAMDDEEAEFSQLKKMTKKIVEQKKNKKYLQDEMKVDDLIEEIDEQDNGANPESKKQQEDELQKAKSVRQQICVWKELAFLRFGLQKNLENLKKFPEKTDLEGFQSEKESNELMKWLEVSTLNNLDKLQKIRNNIFLKAGGSKEATVKKSAVKLLRKFVSKNKIKRQTFENDKALNVQKLWKSYEESFDASHPWIEENILKWSQKTQLLNSLSLKRSGMGALIHTPIGQTQKAMQQFENLVYKSQLKRTTFRILGRDISNVKKETDTEIYDDSDLYHELLKEYMSEIEQNKEVGEDGLLFDSTRLYLLERKLKQQEKKQKSVDRKASKCRKIRFDVHQKLVNFMNPIENQELLEGRNEIIKCLLGTTQEQEQKEESKQEDFKEPSITKKKKGSQKDSNVQAEEGFQLI